MEMLLGEMLLPSQADVGFAGDVQGVVYAVLQLALPLLKGLVVLVLVFGVLGAITSDNRTKPACSYILREYCTFG